MEAPAAFIISSFSFLFFSSLAKHFMPRIFFVIVSGASPRSIRALTHFATRENILARRLPCLHVCVKLEYHFGPLLAKGACRNARSIIVSIH